MAIDNEMFGMNIELSGFREIDSSSMSVIRKNIAHHSRRIQELTEKFERLHITLKPIHEREKSEKYEVHAKLLDNGKVFASKVTERNLIAAIDNVLNKIINEMD